MPDEIEYCPKLRGSSRGVLLGYFHNVAQRGETDARLGVIEVTSIVHYRLVHPQTESDRSGDRVAALCLLSDHLHEAPAESIAFMQAAIDRQSKPVEVIRAEKEAQSQLFSTLSMGGKEPTPKQIDYLKSLGYNGPTPADRLQASKIIDRLVSPA